MHEGMLVTYLKRSCSSMSSMALSWQKMSARCWLMTSSPACPAGGTPIPQSSSSCLQHKYSETLEVTLLLCC